MIGASLIKNKSRGLDYTPAVENLPDAAELMAEDFYAMGYSDEDGERIVNAIDTACRSQPRFPTTFHVKLYMKSKEQLSFDKKEPLKISHQISDKDRKRGSERIKMLMETINSKTETKQEVTPKEVMVSDPEKRARIEAELKKAAGGAKRKTIRTPEEIEAEKPNYRSE